MSEVRNILVGLMISRDSAQISYYDRRQKEPVSVPARAGTGIYSFPMALAKGSGHEEWHIGFEAEYFAAQEGGTRMPNPYEAACGTASVSAGGERADAHVLLGIFIREALRMLGVPRPVSVLAGICVTCPKTDAVLASNILKALRSIGVPDGRGSVMDETESFYYYCYSQKPEIWTRQIGLIRFHGLQASFTRMSEARGSRPFAVEPVEEGSTQLPEDAEERDRMLSEAVLRWTGGSSFSSIFLTGDGFSTEWAKSSVRTMSRAASHVFEGDNLFAKGACYAAYERSEGGGFEGRIYLGPDHTRSELGIDVIEGSRQVFYPLIRAGVLFYVCETECDIIPDGRDDLMLTVRSHDGSRHRNIHLALNGLPERPARATRLRLTLLPEAADRVGVLVEDLGFGELYPATHKLWELSVDL